MEAVAGAMNDLEKCVKEKTRRHMTAVEDMARCVDAGFNSPETIYWCRLVYIPVPKMLKKNVSTKVKEWVHLSELEVALDEQMARIKQIEVKRCPLQRCNSTFINEWDHRWVYHLDSSNQHWTSRLSSSAFLKMNKQTMVQKERQDPRYLGSQARVREVTITKVIESNLIMNEKEAPMSFPEEEPKKRSEKESPVTSSGSGKIDSQVRVPEVTTTAVESDLVVNKREEAPTSFSEEEPKRKVKKRVN